MIQVKKRLHRIALAVGIGMALCAPRGAQGEPAAPRFTLLPAAELRFPGAPPLFVTDCNSPAHWVGETLYIFNSWGHPWRMQGPGLEQMSRADFKVEYNNTANGGRWMEATLQKGETLYGWYHLEPNSGEVCPKTNRTAPEIGALRSKDNGATWEDLGVVLKAPAGDLRCDTPNNYFAGGHGDFSVIEDRAGEFVYFLYDNYGGPAEQQGVSIARMASADLDAPLGKVWKRSETGWTEPGLEGVGKPIFPVGRDWHDVKPDAFWGPSVHWNTHLEQYVIMMNRAIDPLWGQEGYYITGIRDFEDPEGWSTPERLAITPEGPIHMQFYPQLFGVNAAAKETDKLAGEKTRLFIAGVSRWVVRFEREP